MPVILVQQRDAAATFDTSSRLSALPQTYAVGGEGGIAIARIDFTPAVG